MDLPLDRRPSLTWKEGDEPSTLTKDTFVLIYPRAPKEIIRKPLVVLSISEWSLERQLECARYTSLQLSVRNRQYGGATGNNSIMYKPSLTPDDRLFHACGKTHASLQESASDSSLSTLKVSCCRLSNQTASEGKFWKASTGTNDAHPKSKSYHHPDPPPFGTFLTCKHPPKRSEEKYAASKSPPTTCSSGDSAVILSTPEFPTSVSMTTLHNSIMAREPPMSEEQWLQTVKRRAQRLEIRRGSNAVCKVRSLEGSLILPPSNKVSRRRSHPDTRSVQAIPTLFDCQLHARIVELVEEPPPSTRPKRNNVLMYQLPVKACLQKKMPNNKTAILRTEAN